EAKQYHDEAIREISSRIRQFKEQGKTFRIRHGSSNSTRPTSTKGQNYVDTGHLSKVLEVDPIRKVCVVEPNVPMDQLVKATLAHGLVPPVVMEFPGITVGGGFSGNSGESSSFKHGLFECTISLIEIVLANGDVKTCSATENTDLLHGAAGTLGTLGVVTLLEVRLMAAMKYVQTIYHPVRSVQDAIDTLRLFTLKHAKDMDFLEGGLFSREEGVIVMGRLTDDDPPPGWPVQTFSAAKDPWFYLHAREAARRTISGSVDFVPLVDYLFRYDRGAFWAATRGFEYFKAPFNRLTRRLLDNFMHTRVLYKALDASPISHQYIAQDMAVPLGRAVDFIDFLVSETGIWPLWLCPIQQIPYTHLNSFVRGQGIWEPILNVGLWGAGPKQSKDFITLNRRLESKLVELGGTKVLYAHTYYTEDEFWKVYDKDWYDDLRERYGAHSLPSLYDKVKPNEEVGRYAKTAFGSRLMRARPIGGFAGVWRAWRCEEYRQLRAARRKQRMSRVLSLLPSRLFAESEPKRGHLGSESKLRT
ncbi:MAG: hypothetical protein LQ338_003734, partial [Usnochroma carphineum]